MHLQMRLDRYCPVGHLVKYSFATGLLLPCGAQALHCPHFPPRLESWENADLLLPFKPRMQNGTLTIKGGRLLLKHFFILGGWYPTNMHHGGFKDKAVEKSNTPVE